MSWATAVRTLVFAPILAAACVLDAHAEIVTIRIGDRDGFGGTQLCTPCSAGDPFLNPSAPAIGPDHYVNDAGLDATTVDPWRPYVFEFHFPYDASLLPRIVAATVAIWSGSVGRRSDGTGFGYASVVGDGGSGPVGLGEFWTGSTGSAGSSVEEAVKHHTFNVLPLLSASGILSIVIDGSSLPNPVDQFSFDFAELQLVVDMPDDPLTALIGDKDDFGGTQACTPCAPGDSFHNLSSPTIEPGYYVNDAGLDAATEVPWKPYVFEFQFHYDPSRLGTVTAAIVTIRSGSVARRSDEHNGFGHANVVADGGSGPVSLGEFWTESTGGRASAQEESVKDHVFDVLALLSATGMLRVVIDGSALADPSDQFALDFAELQLTPGNEAPTAVAGPNQTVRPGVTVQLDGSASFDDNTPTNQLQFAWSFVSVPNGSGVTLSGAHTVAPSFLPDVAGTYVVQLVVTDHSGLSSIPSQMTVSENPPPTADAGPDQLVILGSVVLLDGSGLDPNGDALTYAWSMTGLPAGSAAQLYNPTLPSTTFIPDRPGVYTVQLTVSDLIGPGTPDSLQITATTASGYAEIQIHDASAGVLALPAGVVTNQGNQNAFGQFLSNALVALQRGQLAAARHQLEQAIVRSDGCALRGVPDANGPSRDWITTCAAQSRVYPVLVEALAAIQP